MSSNTLSQIVSRSILLSVFLILLSNCGAQPQLAEQIAPTIIDEVTKELTPEQVATLSSLEKIDDYPLYTMQYFEGTSHTAIPSVKVPLSFWGCSLFAAQGDPGQMLFGRNFDWEYSPALLLTMNPEDGYRSVSMVDLTYLGFGGEQAHQLTELPLVEIAGLLDAPFLPFDGMNETGLTVGMAAVPPGHMEPDPKKQTIDSVMVIRKMLDQAATVEEAVQILRKYNIDLGSGPPLHYLIADSSGHAVLVEYSQGQMVVFPNQEPWHQATNFLVAEAGSSPKNHCWRYDHISDLMEKKQGQFSIDEALSLLEDVSQPSTQWSVVYNLNEFEIHLVMGGEFTNVTSLSVLDQE